MKIGDKVKFYLSSEIRTGAIIKIWNSLIFKNKKRYAAKDDLGGFIHVDYREGFKVIKE